MKQVVTNRQRRAIEALLTEPTLIDAAEASGVHRNTLAKWLQDAHFRTLLHTAAEQILAQTVHRLSSLTAEAVTTLQQAMHDDEATWGERIRAADVVLSQLARLREHHELARRIAAIEEAIRRMDENKAGAG